MKVNSKTLENNKIVPGVGLGYGNVKNKTWYGGVITSLKLVILNNSTFWSDLYLLPQYFATNYKL